MSDKTECTCMHQFIIQILLSFQYDLSKTSIFQSSIIKVHMYMENEAMFLPTLYISALPNRTPFGFKTPSLK